MNFKIIALIVLVVMTIVLFFFVSFVEMKKGMASLVSGVPVVVPVEVVAETTKNISDSLIKTTMRTIDNIV